MPYCSYTIQEPFLWYADALTHPPTPSQVALDILAQPACCADCSASAVASANAHASTSSSRLSAAGGSVQTTSLRKAPPALVQRMHDAIARSASQGDLMEHQVAVKTALHSVCSSGLVDVPPTCCQDSNVAVVKVST